MRLGLADFITTARSDHDIKHKLSMDRYNEDYIPLSSNWCKKPLHFREMQVFKKFHESSVANSNVS